MPEGFFGFRVEVLGLRGLFVAVSTGLCSFLEIAFRLRRDGPGTASIRGEHPKSWVKWIQCAKRGQEHRHT